MNWYNHLTAIPILNVRDVAINLIIQNIKFVIFQKINFLFCLIQKKTGIFWESSRRPAHLASIIVRHTKSLAARSAQGLHGRVLPACGNIYHIYDRSTDLFDHPDRARRRRKPKRKIILEITYKSTFKNQRINTNQAMGLGCYVAILDGIHRQLVNLQSYDSRIQVIRFEIRLPS